MVEKILLGDEQLPASWPVAGTTGYEVMNRIAALLVDRDGERALTEAFTEYTGQAWDPAGDGKTDSAGRPGDQRRFVFQLEIHN